MGVQSFMSYKVCINLEEEYSSELAMEEVCTHLFSFEKSVPFIPDRDDRDIDIDTSKVLSDTQKFIQEKYKQLEDGVSNFGGSFSDEISDIEGFVEDDFRTSFLKDEE